MTKEQKQAAMQALSEIANAPWSILPEALQALMVALQSISRETSNDSHPDARAHVVRAAARQMSVGGGVATIPIVGIIRPREDYYTKYLGATACSQIIAETRAANANPDVSQIIYSIDSPGGSVLGLAEAAAAIHASGKPTTSVVEGICASAAYYLGSGANRIVAKPSSSVGSIGSIMVAASYVRYFEEMGIDVSAIHFGKNKGDGSPYKPLDDRAKASLQEWVDSYGHQFVDAVAKHRGITSKKVMDDFGQGKVFIASKALAIGMIDAVGDSQTVLSPDSNSQVDDAIHAPAVSTPIVPPTHDLAAVTAVGPTLNTPSASSADAGQASNPTPAATQTSTEKSKVEPRIKALLYALALITDQNASDEVCNAALAAFAAARNQSVPETVEDQIAMLTKSQSSNGAGGNGAAANVQSAHDREMSEASALTPMETIEIRQSIETAAELINNGRPQPVITAEDERLAFESIVKGELTLQAVQAGWRDKITQANDQLPVDTSITLGPAAADRFAVDAVSSLLARSPLANEQDNQVENAVELSQMSLYNIAEKFCQLHGIPVEGFRAEDRALNMLQANPGIISVPSSLGIGAASGVSFNRAGDFANLLSNLAGKILDRAIQLAEVTYHRWSQKMMDLPDFKPATVLSAGMFDQLDEVNDDDESQQLKFSEQLRGWLQVARFANKVGMTPVMLANDDLDGFIQQLLSLAFAHENTINSLNIDVLVANQALPDGIAMFHLDHGNLITPGGAPNATQAEAMRLSHRKQTGVGTNKKIKSLPRKVLCPSDQETAAKQTYYTMAQLAEVKQPTTDANINTHRGTMTDIIVESDLDDISTAQWYTFDSNIRSIVHAFQRGYGRGGRRQSWFEPSRKTRYIELEGRFGSAAIGHRGVCRNDGGLG